MYFIKKSNLEGDLKIFHIWKMTSKYFIFGRQPQNISNLEAELKIFQIWKKTLNLGFGRRIELWGMRAV